MAEFLVEVREQELAMVIGLHPHEQHEPQRVVVTVQVLTADVSGDAAGYVDYDAIVDHIRARATTRIATQEELVRGIHGFVAGLPGVAAARVSSRKPDIFSDCAWVGVSYPARPLV